MTETIMDKHFTDTIFYQIELTAKYCKLLGQQVFEKFNAGITVEEYTTLDTLIYHKPQCQRDLAKLLLKDRANTGKLLDNLEKKGYIKRALTIKNNRPVKSVKVTQAGVDKVNEIAIKIRPHYEIVKEKIQNSNLSQVGNLLEDLRKVLNDTLEIQI